MKSIGPAKKKRTLSFKKKIALQSLVSVLVLLYCIVLAKTNVSVLQREFVHNAVNVTSDSNDIKLMADTAYSLLVRGAEQCGKFFDSIIYFCNNGFGEQADPSAVMARELPHPAIYPQPRQTDTEKQPDPPAQQEAVPQQIQFCYPVEGEITSPYGERIHPVDGTKTVHYGVDIAANHGDSIVAVYPGVVSETGYDANLGYYVKVRHSDTMETVYGHMSEVLVAKDTSVNSRSCIGLVGATGTATGPHVHLEVRIDGVCTDPMTYLPKS